MLDHCLSMTSVLAQQSRIEAMNQGLRAYESAENSSWMVLLGICLLTCAVAGIIVVIVKLRAQQRLCDPHRLFRELCRAHQVTWRQRRLLKSFAKTRKLSDPNQLFLDSSLWAFCPASEPKLCAPAKHRRFLTLQRMFFTHADEKL